MSSANGPPGPHPRRRPLVPAPLRPAVAITSVLCAATLVLMCVRYRDRDDASWIDGVVTGPLEQLGSGHRASLERLVELGDPLPAAAMVAVLAIVALVARGVAGLLLATLAPATAVLLAREVLKPLVGRTDEDGLVFPSTHATVVAAIAAVAALLLLGGGPSAGRTVRRWLAVAGFLAVVAAKTTALAVRDYHYFTDGVGGTLLAVAVVGLVALALDVVSTRRSTDLLAATALAVVLAPLVVVIAAVLLVADGRPVLFRQRRSGRWGREFDIVKFRTMRPERFDGEPDADRESRVGRFLRWSSLDELPQLWNVWAGEMSFIGPRPTLPEQVARYDPRQRGRLSVLPGITGWAQVNGRNSLSWPERIELDLWYIQHRSLALDARILALTALRVLRPSGVVGEGGLNPDFPPRAGGGEGSAIQEALVLPAPRGSSDLDAPTLPLRREPARSSGSR